MASATSYTSGNRRRLPPLRECCRSSGYPISETCFVTENCASKRSIFQVDRNAELFFEVLQHYWPNYKLHPFVIMPDQFHLLLAPQGVTLERCLQLIKGGFCHRYHQEGGLKDVWQKGFADHRCRDREDF